MNKADTKHPLAVRVKDEDGFYTEYDQHDRVVYHRDKWGFFSYAFYHDDKHLRTPYHVVHKYLRLYNPEFS